MTHNVYFWLREDLSERQIEAFENGAATLIDIDCVVSGALSKPASTEERGVTDHSFSYHLSLEFETVDDHDTYQSHPEHEAFLEDCSSLWETVIVYDSELI
jgi:hypothetical protein